MGLFHILPHGKLEGLGSSSLPVNRLTLCIDDRHLAQDTFCCTKDKTAGLWDLNFYLMVERENKGRVFSENVLFSLSSFKKDMETYNVIIIYRTARFFTTVIIIRNVF